MGAAVAKLYTNVVLLERVIPVEPTLLISGGSTTRPNVRTLYVLKLRFGSRVTGELGQFAAGTGRSTVPVPGRRLRASGGTNVWRVTGPQTAYPMLQVHSIHTSRATNGSVTA